MVLRYLQKQTLYTCTRVLSKETVYLFSLFMLLATKHWVSDNAADLAYQLYVANNNVHPVFIPRDNTEEPQLN